MVLTLPPLLTRVRTAHGGEVPWGALMLAWAAAAGPGLALVRSFAILQRGKEYISPWVVGAVATGLMAVAPLLASTLRDTWRTEAALAVLTAAMLAWGDGPERGLRAVASVLVLLAAAADLTITLWPLAMALAGQSDPLRRSSTIGLFMAALAGGCIAVLTSGRMGIGPASLPLMYEQQRAVWLLSPVVVLALASWFSGGALLPVSADRAGETGLRWWGGISLAAVAAAAMGLPIDLRIAGLGLWWLVPAGLDGLIRHVRDRRGEPTWHGWWIGMAAVVGILALPVLLRWHEAWQLTGWWYHAAGEGE